LIDCFVYTIDVIERMNRQNELLAIEKKLKYSTTKKVPSVTYNIACRFVFIMKDIDYRRDFELLWHALHSTKCALLVLHGDFSRRRCLLAQFIKNCRGAVVVCGGI
jgi:hypothetical protein